MNPEPPAYIASHFEEKITPLLRLRLLRIFCLLAGMATFPYLFIFKGMLLLISVIALWGYTVSFLLTFTKHHGIAKYLLILTANSHLFVTASTFGRSAGEQLIYIPVIFGSVLVFNITEKVNLAIAVAVSLICILLLEITDYSLFESTIILAEPLSLYYGNLAITIVCSVTIAFYYNYLSQMQREQFLQTIQVNRETEEAINYFATSSFQSNTQEEILWDIAKNCISKFGFVDCVFYLLNDNKTMLVQKAAYGPKNPENFEIHSPIEIPVGKGIVGSVAATGRPEIVADTSKDSRYIVDDDVRLSEISVPLIYQDEVIGVIDLEHPERNFFLPKHLNILRIIAALASNKIAAARAQQEHIKGEQIQREAERLKEIAITSADDRFLNRAIEIVESQMYDPNFNVEVFIKQMPLQYSQSSRKLKALTGQSPVQFIRLKRLERAAQKLICQEDNITQIAYSVGFNNLSWFAKCFKEQYGKSPSDYMNSVD